MPVAEPEEVAKSAGLHVELHTAPGYGHELGGEELLRLELDEGRSVLDRRGDFGGEALWAHYRESPH